MAMTMEREIMEQQTVTIGSEKDLKRAINFVNNNNFIGHSGFFTALTIKCNVKLKNKDLLVNYKFTNKNYYGKFNKILRSIYC